MVKNAKMIDKNISINHCRILEVGTITYKYVLIEQNHGILSYIIQFQNKLNGFQKSLHHNSM